MRFLMNLFFRRFPKISGAILLVFGIWTIQKDIRVSSYLATTFSDGRWVVAQVISTKVSGIFFREYWAEVVWQSVEGKDVIAQTRLLGWRDPGSEVKLFVTTQPPFHATVWNLDSGGIWNLFGDIYFSPATVLGLVSMFAGILFLILPPKQIFKGT